MRRHLPSIVLSLVLVLLALPGAARAQELDAQVAAAIGRARLNGTRIGVSVIDVQSGRVLASHNENEKLIPASNLKVLTSATALAVLGVDYEFRTQIERHGNTIVIRGSGDPAFADPVLLEQMNVTLDAFMSRLVESITRFGVTRCDEIIVDDRIFDRTYVHPDWPRDQLDKGYCAEVSGLNFHGNVLRIFATPGARESDLATVKTEPVGGGIEIRARAKTVRGPNRSTSISAVRDGNLNHFTIDGTVNAPIREPAETTLHEPGLVFARLLAERLAQAGVRSGDALTSAGPRAASCRLARTDEIIGQPDQVLTVVRTPIANVLRRCNVDSENMYAESLLKLLGRVATGQPGSWINGTGVVRLQVRDRIGPDAAASLFLSDGSGLSRANKVTASILANWLANIARDETIGPAFIASMARARLEGTMRNRFLGKSLINEVRGKSGYISGVRTLSGYVSDSESGRRVAYSVLINDVPGNLAGQAKDLHEDIVIIADRWLARQARDGVEERLGGGESRRKK